MSIYVFANGANFRVGTSDSAGCFLVGILNKLKLAGAHLGGYAVSFVNFSFFGAGLLLAANFAVLAVEKLFFAAIILVANLIGSMLAGSLNGLGLLAFAANRAGVLHLAGRAAGGFLNNYAFTILMTVFDNRVYILAAIEADVLGNTSGGAGSGLESRNGLQLLRIVVAFVLASFTAFSENFTTVFANRTILNAALDAGSFGVVVYRYMILELFLFDLAVRYAQMGAI